MFYVLESDIHEYDYINIQYCATAIAVHKIVSKLGTFTGLTQNAEFSRTFFSKVTHSRTVLQPLYPEMTTKLELQNPLSTPKIEKL